MTTPLYEIRQAPGKGLGVFALSDLPKGTRIIQESPLATITLPPDADLVHHVNTAVDSMSQDAFRTFLRLHHDPAAPNKYLSIWRTNSLSAGPEANKRGVYRDISRINNSCVPNAHPFWREELGKMTIVASRDITAGKEITIGYFHDAPRDRRRQFFEQQFGFRCSCPACMLSGEALEQSDRRRVFLKDGLEFINEKDPTVLASRADDILRACDLIRIVSRAEYGDIEAYYTDTYVMAFGVAMATGRNEDASRYAAAAYHQRVAHAGGEDYMCERLKGIAGIPQ
jgi:hypothetical protein